MAKPASRARQAVWWALGASGASGSSWALLVMAALTCLVGCATGAATSRPCGEGCGGSGFWEKKDDFQRLQHAAGLEEGSWLEEEEELETDDARELWEALAHTETTLQNFGPRRCLVFVLREVLARDEDVPYGALVERLRAFHSLAVMRPDGYLVSAITGRPLQRMGRVELRDGKLMAGAFEVGAFYRDKGGVFYTVGSSLSEPGTLVGELGLERDWFNAALDGGGDALAEMAQALAMLVHDPIRGLRGLEQLPSAVAALIASSPEYFAHYSALPLQEQIREAARLSTHLIMLYGSSAGAATRLGMAGAKLPVLSLTAEGALAIEQVAVPVGTTAAALGTGAGAVYVLMKPPADGFKAFTEDNFRENLARLTGQAPEGAHAHHVFPQKFAVQFRKAGINIHDPKFGAWWERSSHLKKSFAYNSRWEELLNREPPPTLEQILQFGKELAHDYGFQVHY